MAKEAKREGKGVPAILLLGGAAVAAVVALFFATRAKAAPEAAAKWLIRKQQEEEINEEIPETQIEIDPVTGAVQTYDPATGTLTLNVEWEEITFSEARERLFKTYPDLTPERYWADVALYSSYRDWRALMWTGLSLADAAEQALDYLINPDRTLLLIPPQVKEARILWETSGMLESFNLLKETEAYMANPEGYVPSYQIKEPVNLFVCPIDSASFATQAELETYMTATYPPVYSVTQMPPSVQAANPTPAEQAWVSYVMEIVPEASTDYFWTGQF